MKNYHAAIRNLQLSVGLPNPRDTSSLPRLKLMLAGIRRHQARSRTSPPKVRLPITIQILAGMRVVWEDQGIHHQGLLLWAASTICFFGFFRSWQITVPSTNTYDPDVHLSWGDVAFDSQSNPAMASLKLKRSKCDQLGVGVRVFIGRMGTPLCPVAALTAYLASRGDDPGPFFVDKQGRPLTNFFP